MKTRTKHGIVATIGAVAILSGTAPQVSATEAAHTVAKQSDPIATPAAYANYLRHSDEKGATDVLKKFQRLTPPQQQKFISYLHDPTLFKSFFNKSAAQSKAVSAYAQNTKSTTSLRGGDVTIGRERTVTGLSASAKKKRLPNGNHTVKYNWYGKIFGVKIVRLTIWLNFRVKGKNVIKANSAGANKKNFSGAATINKSKVKKDLFKVKRCLGKKCWTTREAEAWVTWDVDMAYKGSVVQFEKEQQVQGNIYGRSGYYMKNV